MSKNSKAVIEWRKRTKRRMVEAMGGQCVECGYKACDAAFDFHHLDPTQKLFGFGGMRANPIAWARICDELSKCVLLCATCHREVEDGYRILSSSTSTFNSQYREYTLERTTAPKRKAVVIVSCIHCKHEFERYTARQKFCNDGCKERYYSTKVKRHHSRPRKTVWPEKDVLQQDIATLTWTAIGKKYGVSDNAVRKWAKSYQII